MALYGFLLVALARVDNWRLSVTVNGSRWRQLRPGICALMPSFDVEESQHNCDWRILQWACYLLTTCLVAAIAECIEVATHEVNLEVGTSIRRSAKVGADWSTGRACNGVIDVNNHDAVFDLSAPSKLHAPWRRNRSQPQRSCTISSGAHSHSCRPTFWSWCTIGLPDAKPVVTIIWAAENPISCVTQLLVPLVNSKRCALNKHHDVRCLVHDEAQHPRFGLMLNHLLG